MENLCEKRDRFVQLPKSTLYKSQNFETVVGSYSHKTMNDDSPKSMSYSSLLK